MYEVTVLFGDPPTVIREVQTFHAVEFLPPWEPQIRFIRKNGISVISLEPGQVLIIRRVE